MNRSICLGLLLLTATATQAQYCPPGCTVVWVDKPIVCTKLEWKEREVKCEVLKPVYREETRIVQRDVVVPEWKDETRDVVTYSYKPRTEIREVCRWVLTPIAFVDPCTGCVHTACKPTPVMEKVCVTVHDCVAETMKVPVKVCHYRTEKRDFKETLIHCDYKRETVSRKELYCEPVTYTTTMKVPVLVPCCP